MSSEHSPTLCVAAGSPNEMFASIDPTGAKPWAPASIPSNARADCPSVSLCLAAGDQGTLDVSTNPASAPGRARKATAN
jgi:hypothetical protein